MIDTLDAVFAALADPTRRQIMQRLVQDGPASATALAGAFPITRQAIVKHLQVLAEAGLVHRERSGREVRYGAAAGGLEAAQRWLASTEAAWDRRLDRLRSNIASRDRPRSAPSAR